MLNHGRLSLSMEDITVPCRHALVPRTARAAAHERSPLSKDPAIWTATPACMQGLHGGSHAVRAYSLRDVGFKADAAFHAMPCHDVWRGFGWAEPARA